MRTEHPTADIRENDTLIEFDDVIVDDDDVPPIDTSDLPNIDRSRLDTVRWFLFHRVTVFIAVVVLAAGALGYVVVSLLDQVRDSRSAPATITVVEPAPAPTYGCSDLGRVNIPSTDPLYISELDADGNGYMCEAPPDSCANAAALGLHDIPSSSPFYAKNLDPDRNGVACTQFYGPEGDPPTLPAGAPNCYSILMNTGRTSVPFGDPLYQSALDGNWNGYACEEGDPVLAAEQAERDAAIVDEPSAPSTAPPDREPQPTTQPPAPRTTAAPAPEPAPRTTAAPAPATTTYSRTVTCSGPATVAFTSRYSGGKTVNVPAGGSASFSDTGPAPSVSFTWSGVGPCSG